ncbi:MAG TPA: 6-phosphogluconolactonase [Candidatus Dormibacteraeota bacterium]|nr:6-phosphogluconolactonase [Candidatus Dormibacteraeota bacterium]
MLSLEVLPSAEDVAAEAAGRIARELQRGARTLVLAGGTTPKRTFELLADQEVAWGRVAVLFGDERCVPWNDPESNYLMAKEALLDRVGPATVYRMPGELGPDHGAIEYEKMVAPLLPLDLVILGVGEDGHTASLFPGHPGLKATGTVIGIHDSPKPPPERITLTLPVLQSAKHVVMLATGAGKADAVAKAKRGEVPSGMIPRARWLIDKAAAGG